jgi:nucleolar protein 14
MAGSQLKQLKAALKEKGLIGQTNVKKKNRKSKTPSETRRDDREQVISDIRGNFNKFDQRINRSKRDVTVIKGGKFVTVGSQQHNDATRSNTSTQKSMKLQYELEKKQKGKNGGISDRRFGESNKHMTAEEKMLERFTRERQAQSKKKNAFSLGSDDESDNDDGFILTHGGKTLAIDDEDDLEVADNKNVRYVDEDQIDDQPPRKKSKKDVMKEIIAKSKFYKHQRQLEQQKTQETIMDLDDEFADVLQEFNEMQTPKPQFSTKSKEDIDYDTKVRELTYDKRSVPADRTKTQEELQKEHDDKLKKLESDRLRRMEGLEAEDREAEADDLDDEFWAGSGDEADGFTIENSEQEDDGQDSGTESGNELNGRPKPIRKPTVIMPSNSEEFLQQISDIPSGKQVEYIRKIIDHYKPNLAVGNKAKMNVFVGIIFEYVLHLSQKPQPDQPLIEDLSSLVKVLAEKFNEDLVECIRSEINHIQTRIINRELLKRDCVFFTLIGYLFSTSDHYHLVVTPSLILMNEILSGFIYEKTVPSSQLYQGVFIVDTLINYQRFSKRYIPEVVTFLEKAMALLLPEPQLIDSSKLLSIKNVIDTNLNLQKQTKFRKYDEQAIQLSLSEIFNTKDNDDQLKFKVIIKIVDIIDRLISLWKDKSVLIEVSQTFIALLKHLVKYYGATLPQSTKILTRLTKLQTMAVKERKPLVLQTHRAIAIATYVPKFEENFNPDKKSYDVNVERQEMNKVKAQLKKERKQALKDIRQETRFVAREQIQEKKKMYDDYHKKMASIVNSISTIEGAEKNEYEREKKLRKSRK